MAKEKSVFTCQQCGYESARWYGRCPECGNWNSAVETVISGKRQELPAGKAGVKGKSGVLYVSGEESVSQIKIRADRLGVKSKNIQLLEETDVDSIIDVISGLQGASLQGVIIDSIQTMYTSDLTGMSGSVGQVRECAYRLVRFAKENNVSIFIVGHVTKQGSVAGPSVLMHIVDTVLWFEGDKSLTLRLLR